MKDTKLKSQVKKKRKTSRGFLRVGRICTNGRVQVTLPAFNVIGIYYRFK